MRWGLCKYAKFSWIAFSFASVEPSILELDLKQRRRLSLKLDPMSNHVCGSRRVFKKSRSCSFVEILDRIFSFLASFTSLAQEIPVTGIFSSRNVGSGQSLATTLTVV